MQANPTEEIIEALKCEQFTCEDYSASYEILEVSIPAVDEYLENRHAQSRVKGHNINVHLGVASSNKELSI